MAVWYINKGVGVPLEFKGLRGQYIYYFIGGLIGGAVAGMLLYILGINQLLSIGIGASAIAFTTHRSYRMNRIHGQYGLMKRTASRCRPKYIANRFRISFLLPPTKQSYFACETVQK